jgi:hypothetical protein
VKLGNQQVSLTNYAAMDGWKRKLRSALISFTAALQIHEYQTSAVPGEPSAWVASRWMRSSP